MKGKVPYLDVRIKEFNWGRIEDIWISQQNGWTCQLAALRIIPRYYHTNISEEDLIKILNEEGFSIFYFGTYLPFMGVIALKLGLKITYRTEIGKKYIGEPAIISSMHITLHTLIFSP
jgi:ABC-type bacteriocin/lantibiotic exporter with double-glycine peptidase domain